MPRLTTPTPVVAALVLAACGVPTGPAETDTPSIDPTVTPTAPATTAAATPTERPSPSESPDDDAFEDAAECENEDIGFEVAYPSDWWANERIEAADGLSPIPACTYFAPDEVELQPNAGLPNGIAVRFELREGQTGTTGEVLSREEVTVDGQAAIAWETEPAPQAGFVPEGSRLYQYIVDLPDGDQLVATTDSILQPESAYAESKAVLDDMMDSLDLDD